MLDGSESEPGSEAENGPAPADTEAFQRAEQPAPRLGLAVSTERYPIADIARWREGTFPHSNELNTERRSKGYKSEPGSEVKTDPHQLTPTVPASTPDARRSWDGWIDDAFG